MSKPYGGNDGPGSVSSWADADTFLIWRTANGDTKRITKANALSGYVTGSGAMTGNGTIATGGYTGTLPATGTFALLSRAQTFSVLQTFGAGITFGTSTLSTYTVGSYTPADASGAGLTLAEAFGKYTITGNRISGECHVKYPTTANSNTAEITVPMNISGKWASITPEAGGYLIASDYASGMSIVYNDSTNRFRFLPFGGSALTNANLSGKYVRWHFDYTIS